MPCSGATTWWAELLQEYADLIAITGGDAFKVRVYEKAARSVDGYAQDISGLHLAGLRRIPGVGTSIAAKIDEYVRTGSIHQLEELRETMPAGVRLLTTIPSLGPKKAMILYEEAGIGSVEDRRQSAGAGCRGCAASAPSPKRTCCTAST
ncbi:helix-hairpin-helix domain-containing protein [Nonomuraea lactucae]|uniref:helix-hairpin-helix domain-containing protein n=1 Tax=Nonomuraea lactucae TaxID=2249762 RepID=UPI001F06F3D0|nr:helix-hairpin-helix domain-containing protein [Nonomuraea lactucae]